MQSEQGATLIEFVFAFFFLAVFTIMTSISFWFCFQTAALQWLSVTSIRQIALGQSALQAQTDLVAQAGRYGIELDAGEVRICPTTVVDCPPGAALDGASEQLVFIRVEHSTTFAIWENFGGVPINVTATAVGKIEPH